MGLEIFNDNVLINFVSRELYMNLVCLDRAIEIFRWNCYL